MTSPHVTEHLEGHLLGALDSADAARVASHLDACMDCAALLADAREVLAVLPASLEPMEPRASLKSQIMTAAMQAQRDENGPAPLPLPQSTQGRQRPPPWLAIAAGVFAAAAAAAVVWALVLQARLDDRDKQLADARLAAGAFANSSETLRMESEFSGNAVEAAIAMPSEGTIITVVVTGLPGLQSGDGYRLWLFADGQPQTGVPLTPDGQGNVVAQLDVDLAQFDAMELDAQPLEATAPGGELVIGGPLR